MSLLFHDMAMTEEEALVAMERGAVFSECLRYRTRLFRTWDRRRPGILFIMLNPSTADAEVDDPTVRRCIGFAVRWGYGHIEVRNIFALRSTSPWVLYTAEDPVGDNPIVYPGDDFGKVVVAWGNHGSLGGRGNAVLEMLVKEGIPVYHFGLTREGQPRHPLYLRNDVTLEPITSESFWQNPAPAELASEQGIDERIRDDFV